jgi:hypothetical protein
MTSRGLQGLAFCVFIVVILNLGIYRGLKLILERWKPSTFGGRYVANNLRLQVKMYPYLAAVFAILLFGMLAIYVSQRLLSHQPILSP